MLRDGEMPFPCIYQMFISALLYVFEVSLLASGIGLAEIPINWPHGTSQVWDSQLY